uniref:Uncharacterized protein n=1 Tax=Anguilla anguilla TaxID=7936 RepID=A0A0E9SDQ5_ANGAN
MHRTGIQDKQAEKSSELYKLGVPVCNRFSQRCILLETRVTLARNS